MSVDVVHAVAVIGYEAVPDVVPNTLGISIIAELYHAASDGDTRYAALAAAQKSWLYGANAWGQSFIIGAVLNITDVTQQQQPAASVTDSNVNSNFPHCPQSQIANLLGTLQGANDATVLRGATTGGPYDYSALLQQAGGGALQDGQLFCWNNGTALLGDSTGSAGWFANYTSNSLIAGTAFGYLDSVSAYSSTEPAIDYTSLNLFNLYLALRRTN